MDLLSYTQIFASYFCSIVLTVLPGVVSYKSFSLIIAFISFCFIAQFTIRRKCKIPKYAFLSGCIIVLIVIDFWLITPIFYNAVVHENRDGAFLAMVGQTIPAILTGFIVGADEDIQERMKDKSIYIASVFAIIAFIGAVHPNLRTASRFAFNTNNLNYQSLSYMGAFSSAMAEYYLVFRTEEKKRKTLLTLLGFSVIILDLLTILLAGGRGGFVTYFVLLLISILLVVRKKGISARKIVKHVLVICLFVIASFLVYQYVSNANISTSGFSRIVGFLKDSSDSIRDDYRRAAMSSFYSSPIIGHGFGSVYFEIGFYSHNIFTDLLVETGIIGTLFFALLLGFILIRSLGMIKRRRNDALWFYILLCGLIEFSFSGYYLASAHIWWIIAFLFSKTRDARGVSDPIGKG